MHPFLIALFSILLSVCAQFVLKTGVSDPAFRTALSQPFGISTILAMLRNEFLLAGFILYGIGAVIWLAVLSRWDVSKAYPLVGLGFVITLAVGWALGEHIVPLRVAGVGLICAGIICVGTS